MKQEAFIDSLLAILTQGRISELSVVQGRAVSPFTAGYFKEMAGSLGRQCCAVQEIRQ